MGAREIFLFNFEYWSIEQDRSQGTTGQSLDLCHARVGRVGLDGRETAEITKVVQELGAVVLAHVVGVVGLDADVAETVEGRGG